MLPLGTLEGHHIVYLVVVMVLHYGKVLMVEKTGKTFPPTKVCLQECGELAVLLFLQ